MNALLASLTEGDWLTRDRIKTVAGTVIFFTVVVLAGLFVTAQGNVDVLQRPLGTDFASFYTAGRDVLAGHPGAPYDAALQYAHEQAAFGKHTPFYNWPYPPFFLLVAAALALLPYAFALLVWQGATLALYLYAIAGITRAIRTPETGLLWLLVALGFPAVFVNLGHGQNGFLSTALIGLALLHLDKRPWLAGILFGLLAYKPQLGVMVPIVLLATGRWRTLAGAALTVLALSLTVAAVLGTEVFKVFLAATPALRITMLDSGGPGWAKIQTVFAWVRLWGGSLELAYFIQSAVTLTLAGMLILLWRGPSRFAWKAAGLAVATIVAAPFSLDYDMTVLAVAIAFLVADGFEFGFARWEKTLLAALWLVPLVARIAALDADIPLGAIVVLTTFAFIVRRAPSITPVDRMAAVF